MKESKNYSNLAPLYDLLMKDVDYEAWADYVDEIIQEHHPDAENIMELACGTGSIALSLDELGYYSVTGTDLSLQMIEVARQKAVENQQDVHFYDMDFTNITTSETFDVIYSVFDSINYLHSSNEILKMLSECRKILAPDGLLIFDFSTPTNSLQSVDYLNNEEAQKENLRFFRTSSYDHQSKIHTNIFEIERLSDDKKQVIEQFKEVHQQKNYTLQEMLTILKQTPYHLLATYGDFDLHNATNNSARITVVLQC